MLLSLADAKMLANMILVFAATALIFCARYLGRARMPDDVKQAEKDVGGAVMTVLLAILLLGGANYVYNTASSHGMDAAQAEQISPFRAMEISKLSFTEEQLPKNYEDLKGKLVIFYRFGCRDCMAIHDELLDCLSDIDQDDIYYVNSRSDQGRKLLEQFPVQTVPSGIYIGHNVKYVAKQLFIANNNEVKLDPQNLARLLELLYVQE